MDHLIALIDPGKAASAFFLGLGIVVGFIIIRWLRGFIDAKSKVKVYEFENSIRRLKDAQDNLQLSDLILRANDDMRKRTDSGDDSNSN